MDKNLKIEESLKMEKNLKMEKTNLKMGRKEVPKSAPSSDMDPNKGYVTAGSVIPPKGLCPQCKVPRVWDCRRDFLEAPWESTTKNLEGIEEMASLTGLWYRTETFEATTTPGPLFVRTMILPLQSAPLQRLDYYTWLVSCIPMSNGDSLTVDDLLRPWAESLHPSLESLREADLECATHFEQYFDHLEKNHTTWALQMLDASAKTIPSGILEGNIYDMGMYHQCLEINVKHLSVNSSIASAEFRGQHCFYKFHVRNYSRHSDTHLPWLLFDVVDTIIFRSACVPSTCNEMDLTESWNSTLRIPGLMVSVVDCQDNTGTERSISEQMFLLVMSLIGLLVVLGTLTDLFVHHRGIDLKLQGNFWNSLVGFSLYTNCKRIFETAAQTEDSIDCLHGIRVLSLLWVIWGNTYRFVSTNAGWANPSMGQTIHESKWTAMLFRSDLASDSFLFLSGVLVSFSLLKELDRNRGRFQPLMYYLHRYIRLTPPYAITIWFTASWFTHINSGPFWSQQEFRWCQQKWYQNLLYIQTFFYDISDQEDLNDICIDVSWYLAVDTQLYILAPLVVLPLWHAPKLGIILLVSTTSFGVYLRSILLHVNQWSGILDAFSDEPERTTKLYARFYARFGPYFVGILAGFCLSQARNQGPLTMSRKAVIFGWISSLFSIIWCIFFPAPWSSLKDGPMDPDFSRLYASIFRTLWGIALAWIVLASEFGYGRITNTVLSNPIFIPLSRLSYCSYLVHTMILSYYGYSQTQLHDASHTRALIYFAGCTPIILFVALLLHLTFEAPALNLERLFLRKVPQKSTSRANISVTASAGTLRANMSTAPSAAVLRMGTSVSSTEICTTRL
ncbi:unnamed protein product [Cyprideis torosa]|uniref:Uncharacterized protein n=1 Tax=Cyprideis torosa TaxID=163714 RepID=A0A7R8WI12_9CRUS|nr:unnamed protein product [Cyprideis torosa]CAG0900137.1 unnamed protein product [Cyprideis torosa]